ncbi:MULTISPECIES: DUF2612 domain-containing protein [unclassified Aurantimonas]|uniref:DUF2612 domain-containing protein n=1 Tax=unclassified Aurantimonas TaxID=2638230 RepID=UPI002E184FF2|nr:MULTISPECIES: DUF2612 domain-containing protein [unclassified Aurantimonas]MEC5289365.1 DUF2612 domain-containing protein [Aurantimonas sp. C2-3-R2]MEC5410445.1 DUF2612 domain-containing protein [Aurantimonas sp. C2-4-R8]
MAVSDMVEPRIDHVLTQFRESPKLLHVIRTALRQVQEAAEAIDAIPSFFDIDNAVGDQLTIIGKALGWPRTHCICDVQPVFGFECEGIGYAGTIAGFCDDNSTWAACDERGFSDITLTDDDLYRKFLKVRRYQFLGMFDRGSLAEAVKTFWGDTALVLDDRNRRVVVAPGRVLTSAEEAVIQLYPRVLPIAIGMQIRFHFGTNFPTFGFGEGWGGFCEPYPGSPVLATEDGALIVTDQGAPIAIISGSDWVCPVDVHPYTCA